MNFKDKKIALLGFGLENKALLPYLARQGAKITICDRDENLSRLGAGISYILGDNYLKSLSGFDIIFRSPGIPFLTAEIQEARKQRVLISSQTKLFFELCPAKIIGVTGTKGKGTTASLLFEMLKRAAGEKEIKGNIF